MLSVFILPLEMGKRQITLIELRFNDTCLNKFEIQIIQASNVVMRKVIHSDEQKK